MADGSVAATSLAIILLWPRLTKRFPGSIVALLLSTAAVAVFHLPIETIGSKFGGIPQGFPHFALPNFRADHILPVASFRLHSCTACGSREPAVGGGCRRDERRSPQLERGTGGAGRCEYRFSSLWRHPRDGCDRPHSDQYPFRRTDAGSGHGACAHAACDSSGRGAAGALCSAGDAGRGVIRVAYNMGEWREIGTILRLSKTDIAVWFTTFALTVFADLTVAVGVGMALAALLYIYRISETTTVEPVTREYLRDGQAHILQDKDIPPNVTILRIHGPFLFGTTEKLAEATKDLALCRCGDPAASQYDGARCDRHTCA